MRYMSDPDNRGRTITQVVTEDEALERRARKVAERAGRDYVTNADYLRAARVLTILRYGFFGRRG